MEVSNDLGALREDWSRLAAESGSVFASWEWAETWWRHFGRGRRLELLVCRNDESEVVSIVPCFVFAARPLRILRFVGHGHGDFLGPICRKEDDALWNESLSHALEREPFDVFVGDWVPNHRDWDGFAARALREDGYPIARLEEESWEAYLAGRSPTFRREARSHLRRLERSHSVTFRETTAAETLQADLDVVYRLHRSRLERHRGCHFCDAASERFHRTFAATALEQGWLRVRILELDGQPVAASYGFTFGDTHFAYQVGRDPAWDRASVGFVLDVHNLRTALEDGVREYRLLVGHQPYKYRFADDDPGVVTIGVPGSKLGRAALTALGHVPRIPGAGRLVQRLAR